MDLPHYWSRFVRQVNLSPCNLKDLRCGSRAIYDRVLPPVSCRFCLMGHEARTHCCLPDDCVRLIPLN
ncbi:hypothetical protein CEXT_60811 [Caerostris extrusa]|uniref:Uncharacterized protein n=1 Tax=Caerostris extrusa TaxID=172846 RepID=A0AAV4UIP1_CAEEX|nr:hypothetical protein CEXT_60811 [Caerostris extrusa]